MKIKGSIINTADGSTTLPPAPVPPSRAEIDRIKALQAAVDKTLAVNSANWETLSSGDREFTIRKRALSDSYTAQIKSLEAQYAADYARYQQELADWTKLKTAIAQTDPELAKAMAAISESTTSASGKKYITIGIVIAVVAVAIGFTIYLIKKRKAGK